MSNDTDCRVGESGGVLALTISYHGGGFEGSQKQGARRTVQRELERALESVWETASTTVFAGRTDRGVHAAGQVVSTIDRRPDLGEDTLRSAINSRLPHDVSVVRVMRRPAGFHARFDARWREYRYHLWCGPRQPLVTTVVAQRSRELAVERMAAAANRLIGRHDLAAFAGDGEGVPWSERRSAPRGTVREISVCTVAIVHPWWAERLDGELIEIRVAADGFLPKMVRNITGALIEVGSGRQSSDWIAELIACRDRRRAGMTAQAHGLTLWRVGYDGDLPDGPEPMDKRDRLTN